MKPELVSTCVYTRIQNCTSCSSSGGRGMGFSAARAGTAPNHASAQAARITRAAHVRPVVKRVGFIYSLRASTSREHSMTWMGQAPGAGERWVKAVDYSDE